MVYSGLIDAVACGGDCRVQAVERVAAMSETPIITEYDITDHARTEMERRNISEAEIAQVLLSPQQMVTVREGRVVYQSRQQFGDPPRTMLLRIFVDVDRRPAAVVTSYRTSRVENYWRSDT